MTFPSQSVSDLDTTDWDVVVIGAGPGGSLTARVAARQGLKTLLIEARAWLSATAVRLVRIFPKVASYFVQAINRPASSTPTA